MEQPRSCCGKKAEAQGPKGESQVTDRELISRLIEACQQLTNVVGNLNRDLAALQARVYALEVEGELKVSELF